MSFAKAAFAAPSRRIFLTSVSLLALAGPSLAADLPVKAPPPAIAASWAGFYLGIHGGYGWKKDDFHRDVGQLGPGFVDGVTSRGAVYGAQAGYNWQFNRIVTGLEIDFSATGIKGRNGLNETLVIAGVGTFSASTFLDENVKYLGTARARLGWLPTDNVLLYGTAGLAWERLDLRQSSIQNFPPIFQSITQRLPTDKFGWVAGAGVEVMLGGSNWIGRLEYLHYDLGQVQNASSFTQTIAPAVVSTAGSQTIDIVRAGISYKFGEPARIASAAYAKAPIAPLPSSPSSWAGFYLGAHGGYGWGDDPFSFPLVLFGATGTVDGTKSQGWVAGGQIGHNWQYNRVVTGFEIDLSAADIRGKTSTGSFTAGTQTISFDDKVKYLGTVRGRLGWTPTETVLLYGTAGLAWERLERGQTQTQSVPPGASTTTDVAPSDRFGWVAGAGVEVMLGSPNWIGRLEYLHYDFGRVLNDATFNLAQPGTNITGSITAGHQTIDLVRAGVSYKFGPEVAVAAAPAMYAKAPRIAPPLQGWAGFYFGAHAGYGWKDNDYSTELAAPIYIGGINSKGWLGGGQAGYNWQYGRAVAGLEIDGTATGIKGSSRPVPIGTSTDTDSDNVKYLGTVRGRLGWTPAATWLLYSTGGLAWERVHRTTLDVDIVPGNVATSTGEGPRDHFGWVAGAGVETMLGTSNWIARLEYLHYDFGTVESIRTRVTTIVGQAPVAERGGRQTIEAIRAGVSYKFTP